MITVPMMFHRAIKIGGWYWHKLLCIPVDHGNNMSVYRMIELAIHKLYHFPNRIEFIWGINMISNDKIGQTPAEFDNVIDNVFKVVCGLNFQKGNKFLLVIYDPAQLQPIRGCPFLVSPFVIPCFKIIPIKNSVFAQDNIFFRIQHIARKSYKEPIDNSQLIGEFEWL